MLNFLANHDLYLPEKLDFFGLLIPIYGLCIIIGILIAVYAAIREGKKLGIASEDIYTGVIIIAPLAIVGARLWYILFNLDEGWPLDKILGLDGNGMAGLAIQGGIIAAVIAIIFYCRWKRISLYKILDIVAPGFLIGQICGRWGNFFNHELFGPKIKHPDLFEKLLPEFITENMRISPADGGNGIDYYHPTFLYESALNLVGLIIMLVLRRKFKKLKTGDLVGIYLVWYGLVRIFTESLRSMSGQNEILKLGPIPVSIALSVIFIICGITFLIVKRIKGPQDYYGEVIEYIKENKVDTVLFDLDGTLLNTKPLIDRSFVHTFSHFRPDYQLSEEELDSFFGPTLSQTFSRYSDNEKEIEEMIAYYRKFNIANHDSMVKVFPGANALVITLHKKGFKLGVVSSKKTDLVRHGLELFGLLDKMDIVIGADEVSNHKPAPDGILLAKEKLNGKNVIYVGDTANDIAAAKAANVKAIGVLYIKNPEVMLEAKPDDVVKNLNEILKICGE